MGMYCFGIIIICTDAVSTDITVHYSLHLWIYKLNRVCGSVEKVKTTSIIPFVGFLFQEFMGQSLF